MNIGAKIKLLRKEKKVTQEELAEYLMISSQAVSKWETAAYYLAKIPSLHFLYCEVAAGITRGQERLKNIEKTEDLCVWILLSMLKLRREEADAEAVKELNEQFREMITLFKAYPSYRKAAKIAEVRWREQMD